MHYSCILFLTGVFQEFVACSNFNSKVRLPVKWYYQTDERLLDTVNVIIFAGGKFRENVGKTFRMGVIFTILLLFPS